MRVPDVLVFGITLLLFDDLGGLTAYIVCAAWGSGIDFRGANMINELFNVVLIRVEALEWIPSVWYS